jgi:predicted transcriptional regulator
MEEISQTFPTMASRSSGKTSVHSLYYLLMIRREKRKERKKRGIYKIIITIKNGEQIMAKIKLLIEDQNH